jgi:hypothetical protein
VQQLTDDFAVDEVLSAFFLPEIAFIAKPVGKIFSIMHCENSTATRLSDSPSTGLFQFASKGID